MSNPGTRRPPRIVAELGRPETPEETAARKAENSRKHRVNQTTRNLVLALLASLGLVLFLVLVVVRPDGTPSRQVDYLSVASEAQPVVTTHLSAPRLPDGWRSNNAELSAGTAKSYTWTIGFLTPHQQFIALEEGIDTTDAWFGSQLGRTPPTGAMSIDGVDWTVYDQRAYRDPGNYGYSLATTINDTRYLLHGTAATGEFHVLARAVARDLHAVEGE